MDKKLIDKINNIYWKYNVGPQIVSKPQDLAVLTSMCAFGKNSNRGPIGVCNCILNDKEEVILITLGGTQFKDGQATRLLESKLSMSGKDNDYLRALVKLLNEEIPNNKPLIISGISLGGMIAQQLLSIKEVIDKFTIKSIITFGSPLTMPLDRKNIRIKRFSEKGDIVPKFGLLRYKLNFKKRKLIKELDLNEKIIEDGKYRTKLESHALSYVENKNWDKYDFFGVYNGNNKLQLTEEIKFYEAPIIEK